MQLKKNNTQAGITMVEMAMVVLIISIVVVVVVSAVHLKESGEVNAIIAEVNMYQSAIQSFYDNYNAMPGDMRNASSYWGDACGGDFDAPAGCNGNGNEDIFWNVEGPRAMQHLELAEMIPESGLTGTADISGSGHIAVIGVNVPISRTEKGGYALSIGILGNMIVFGTETSNNINTNPALKPWQAFSLDKKIDDGTPIEGDIRGSNYHSPTSCWSGPPGNRTYTLISDLIECSMVFKIITNPS